MSRWTALALGALFAAVACGVVALVRFSATDSCALEGAYFNRSEGAPAYAGVFESACDEFSLGNPYLWTGAAAAFVIAAAAVMAVARLRRGVA